MSPASPVLTIHAFRDDQTGTVSYVLADPATRQAAIVDPVLDFDLKSGRTATTQADRLLAHVAEAALTVQWILETHAHADHLSAARYLQAHVGGRIAIGEHIREVQAVFRKLYNLERDFLPDGRQFDHLFRDGETFLIGGIEAQALLVPGHTPACLAYRIGDAVFVGDTMFMPDVGTARGRRADSRGRRRAASRAARPAGGGSSGTARGRRRRGNPRAPCPHPA